MLMLSFGLLASIGPIGSLRTVGSQFTQQALAQNVTGGNVTGGNVTGGNVTGGAMANQTAGGGAAANQTGNKTGGPLEKLGEAFKGLFGGK